MKSKGTLVLGLAVLYVATVGVLHSLQRQIVFPGPGDLPRAVLESSAREAGATEISLRTRDGETLYGWHVPSTASGTRRVVVYFHGNASSLIAQRPLQDLIRKAGWDFVGIHYRGYPLSSGSPSEAGLLRDADAAWDFAREDLGVPAARIVVHGRSLGGGVASQLAVRAGAAGVVLESTFTSLTAVAKGAYPWLPVGWLLADKFDSAKVAAEIQAPALVLHGSADSIIPIEHGRSLDRLLPQSTFIEAAGVDHNDPMIIGEVAEAYVAFLERTVPQ